MTARELPWYVVGWVHVAMYRGAALAARASDGVRDRRAAVRSGGGSIVANTRPPLSGANVSIGGGSAWH